MSIYKQGKMFDAPWQPKEHARTLDAGTSHAAAKRMAKPAGHLMNICLAAIKLAPGTQAEIARRLNLPVGMIWKRLSDLKNQGEIEPSGETRPGPSGRQQTVWRVRA